MTSLKLYKLLQDHVGKMNALAVKLSQEKLTKDEVKEQAEASAKELLAALNPNP